MNVIKSCRLDGRHKVSSPFLDHSRRRRVCSWKIGASVKGAVSGGYFRDLADRADQRHETDRCQGSQAKTDGQTGDPVNAGRLKRILAYLSANLEREDLTPGNIARHFALSERTLHRMFRSQNLTVCGWIRQARLRRCAAILRDPLSASSSVTEIAFGNGFNDCAHFSRVFKELFLVTPTEYRKSN